MATKNDITGDALKSKSDNQESFSSGWDLIWGNKVGSTYGIRPLNIDKEIAKLTIDKNESILDNQDKNVKE